MNNIARIIKALMEIHNLTQVDFAVKSDVPLPTVRKYLRSEFNPTEKNIKKIEKNFSVKISELLEIDLNDLDKLEEMELFYKTFQRDVAIKFEGLEDVKIALEISNLHENSFDVCNEYYEAKAEFVIAKNTLDLITFLEKNISKTKKIIDTFDKIVTFNDFKTSDKILINLLKRLDFDIQAIENTRKFIIKKENSTYKMDYMLFENILMLLKKDVSDNFLKYLKILDIEIKDTD